MGFFSIFMKYKSKNSIILYYIIIQSHFFKDLLKTNILNIF